MRVLRVSGLRGAALLAAALALAPAEAAAQELAPGTRVRVTAPIASRNSRFVGTVAAADSARLTVRLDPAVRQAVPGDSVVIPRALIRRVEVSLGRSVARRSHAAATGAVAGAFVGVGLGLVLAERHNDNEEQTLHNPWETASVTGPLGAAAGAAVGYLIGQRAREEWRRLPGYASVGVPPGGGIAVAVSLRR
ncbi:MAG TPA: hypothetical protein VF746_19370 [Longimicrobium sp.]|jgi:hypothetical protein